MRCVKTQVAAWAGAAEQSIPGSFGLHLKNKTTVECSASGAGRAAEQWGGISVSCTLSSSSVNDGRVLAACRPPDCIRVLVLERDGSGGVRQMEFHLAPNILA